MDDLRDAIALGLCWAVNNLDDETAFGLDFEHLKKEMFKDLGLNEEIESITCDGNCKGCKK